MLKGSDGCDTVACFLEQRIKYLGDNCIQNFIWGGIASFIWSEISFYGDTPAGIIVRYKRV